MLIILISLLLCVGCTVQIYVPPTSTAHYEHQLSAWQGKTIAELPKDWGPPSVSTSTVEGRLVQWPNTPRWGCLTTAVTDSSGTILSWQLDGASCMTEYSDDEIRAIRAKLIALKSFVRTLKRGDSLRLSFYEDAVDVASHPAEKPLDCYFLHYSAIVQEITIRTTPEPKHGFTFGKDIYTYDLKYISDIAVLNRQKS
jgi:hypothetical protein